MPFTLINGVAHDVTICGRGESFSMRIGKGIYEASMDRIRDGEYGLVIDGKTHQIWLATSGDRVFVHAFGRHWDVEISPFEITDVETTRGQADVSFAPMPGVIVDVAVKQGQSVTEGQTLLTMESMKLQTTIAAYRNGVVAEVNVTPGDKVEKAFVLIRLVEGDT